MGWCPMFLGNIRLGMSWCQNVGGRKYGVVRARVAGRYTWGGFQTQGLGISADDVRGEGASVGYKMASVVKAGQVPRRETQELSGIGEKYIYRCRARGRPRRPAGSKGVKGVLTEAFWRFDSVLNSRPRVPSRCRLSVSCPGLSSPIPRNRSQFRSPPLPTLWLARLRLHTSLPFLPNPVLYVRKAFRSAFTLRHSSCSSITRRPTIGAVSLLRV